MRHVIHSIETCPAASRLLTANDFVRSCGQVADLVKMDRLNRLNRVVNEVAEERAQRFAGRELEVHFSLLYADIYSYLQLGVRAHRAKFGVLCLRQLITSMLAPRTAHPKLWLCLRDLQLTADTGSARAPWITPVQNMSASMIRVRRCGTPGLLSVGTGACGGPKPAGCRRHRNRFRPLAAQQAGVLRCRWRGSTRRAGHGECAQQRLDCSLATLMTTPCHAAADANWGRSPHYSCTAFASGTACTLRVG